MPAIHCNRSWFVLFERLGNLEDLWHRDFLPVAADCQARSPIVQARFSLFECSLYALQTWWSRWCIAWSGRRQRWSFSAISTSPTAGTAWTAAAASWGWGWLGGGRGGGWTAEVVDEAEQHLHEVLLDVALLANPLVRSWRAQFRHQVRTLGHALAALLAHEPEEEGRQLVVRDQQKEVAQEEEAEVEQQRSMSRGRNGRRSVNTNSLRIVGPESGLRKCWGYILGGVCLLPGQGDEFHTIFASEHVRIKMTSPTIIIKIDSSIQLAKYFFARTKHAHIERLQLVRGVTGIRNQKDIVAACKQDQEETKQLSWSRDSIMMEWWIQPDCRFDCLDSNMHWRNINKQNEPCSRMFLIKRCLPTALPHVFDIHVSERFLHALCFLSSTVGLLSNFLEHGKEESEIFRGTREKTFRCDRRLIPDCQLLKQKGEKSYMGGRSKSKKPPYRMSLKEGAEPYRARGYSISEKCFEISVQPGYCHNFKFSLQTRPWQTQKVTDCEANKKICSTWFFLRHTERHCRAIHKLTFSCYSVSFWWQCVRSSKTRVGFWIAPEKVFGLIKIDHFYNGARFARDFLSTQRMQWLHTVKQCEAASYCKQ